MTRRSRSTRRDQAQAATLAKYGGELVVYSVHSFRLAAEVPGRTGAVAIAALALVPLAGFAAKRRWGAFVLGGAVAILALMLVPELFTRFSNAVSLSQSRRAAGFLPFAFAFAGGLALLARSVWVLPFALAAGIVLERQWPGDFAYGLHDGGPGAVTWFALVGGAIALVIGIVARPQPAEGALRPRRARGPALRAPGGGARLPAVDAAQQVRLAPPSRRSSSPRCRSSRRAPS